MMSRRPTSLAPRLRPTRGQLVLAAVLALLLATLVASRFVDSAAQAKYNETYARTETATNNMLYTMRETLAYVDASNRYLLGAVPRRNVQMARALLAQRLSVVGETGLTAGDTRTAEYRAALQAMDDAVAQAPPGVIPPDQRERVAAVLLPPSEQLSETGRRLVDTTANQLHTTARASSDALCAAASASSFSSSPALCSRPCYSSGSPTTSGVNTCLLASPSTRKAGHYGRLSDSWIGYRTSSVARQ